MASVNPFRIHQRWTDPTATKEVTADAIECAKETLSLADCVRAFFVWPLIGFLKRSAGVFLVQRYSVCRLRAGRAGIKDALLALAHGKCADAKQAGDGDETLH